MKTTADIVCEALAGAPADLALRLTPAELVATLRAGAEDAIRAHVAAWLEKPPANDTAKRPRGPGISQRRGWEKRKENDERAAREIPADFLPLWEREKSRFKGTPEDRARRFLEWAYANGSAVTQAMQDEADETLAAWLKSKEGRAA
jgi:hypothetical protein